MPIPSSTVTTNTYSFSPSAGDTVLYAFSLCGMRRTELQQTDYIDAAMAFNMAMVNLTNHIPMKFVIETEIIALSANTPAYNLTERTVAVPIVSLLVLPPNTSPAYVYANYGHIVADLEGNEIVLDVGGTNSNSSFTERVLGPISAINIKQCQQNFQTALPTAYWFGILLR